MRGGRAPRIRKSPGGLTVDAAPPPTILVPILEKPAPGNSRGKVRVFSAGGNLSIEKSDCTKKSLYQGGFWSFNRISELKESIGLFGGSQGVFTSKLGVQDKAPRLHD